MVGFSNPSQIRLLVHATFFQNFIGVKIFDLCLIVDDLIERGLEQLLSLLEELKFVGVPAAAGLPAVRKAVEEAWFAQRTLKVRYRNAEGIVTARTVRLEGVVMERSLTLLNCVDTANGQRRQLRLDRLESAVVS